MFGWFSVRPISASRRKRSRNSGSSSRLAERPLERDDLLAALGLEDRGHPAAAERLEQAVLAEPLLAAGVDSRARVHERAGGREAARIRDDARGLRDAPCRIGRCPAQREPRDRGHGHDGEERERQQAGAAAARFRSQRAEDGAERLRSPGDDLDLDGRVGVVDARYAHAVASRCQARLHQTSRAGVRAADRLVVEVDRGTRRLGEHLERARGLVSCGLRRSRDSGRRRRRVGCPRPRRRQRARRWRRRLRRGQRRWCGRLWSGARRRGRCGRGSGRGQGRGRSGRAWPASAWPRSRLRAWRRAPVAHPRARARPRPPSARAPRAPRRAVRARGWLRPAAGRGSSGARSSSRRSARCGRARGGGRSPVAAPGPRGRGRRARAPRHRRGRPRASPAPAPARRPAARRAPRRRQPRRIRARVRARAAGSAGSAANRRRPSRSLPRRRSRSRRCRGGRTGTERACRPRGWWRARRSCRSSCRPERALRVSTPSRKAPTVGPEA